MQRQSRAAWLQRTRRRLVLRGGRYLRPGLPVDWVDHFTGDSLTLVPVAMTIGGMIVLIAGSAYMVAESQLGAQQIVEEIARRRSRMLNR